ncbi:MAG TPA: hypothetical protein VGX23_36700 [Actinocrinis sp.]|nr:hypothetical protein [Actinocrinis sp.]
MTQRLLGRGFSWSTPSGLEQLGGSRVTVYAGTPADPGLLLQAIAPLGTGDTFCSTDPEDDSGRYTATISDTVATFVLDVAQDPGGGTMPAAVVDQGWTTRQLTGYEIVVPDGGPGSLRLKYRLAKAVLTQTGGVLVDSAGKRIALEALADSPFGSLW